MHATSKTSTSLNPRSFQQHDTTRQREREREPERERERKRGTRGAPLPQRLRVASLARASYLLLLPPLFYLCAYSLNKSARVCRESNNASKYARTHALPQVRTHTRRHTQKQAHRHTHTHTRKHTWPVNKGLLMQ